MRHEVVDNCTNYSCPYWDKDMEEHCGYPGEQSDTWIIKYCSNQKIK